MLKKILILCANLAIPLGIGLLSYMIIKGNFNVYDSLALPFFAPPKVVFSIIWIILYTLMGVSTYIVVMKQQKIETQSICVYALQLFFNFVWPILFFISHFYLFASIWLLVLIFFICWMTRNFYLVNKVSAYLQSPYLLWSIYACVLNFSIFFLNM